MCVCQVCLEWAVVLNQILQDTRVNHCNTNVIQCIAVKIGEDVNLVVWQIAKHPSNINLAQKSMTKFVTSMRTINSWHTCAARVTVLVLCVCMCLSVCILLCALVLVGVKLRASVERVLHASKLKRCFFLVRKLEHLLLSMINVCHFVCLKFFEYVTFPL